MSTPQQAQQAVAADMLSPLQSSHLHIARPSRDLRQAERFWVQGAGMRVLYRADSDGDGGHALVSRRRCLRCGGLSRPEH